MIRGRFTRGGGARGERAASTEEAPLFNLDEIYERRILSWSPEPEDELAADEAQLDDEPADVRAPAPSAPEIEALGAAAPAEEVVLPVEPPAAEAEAEDQPAAARRRGRPRGRPRRQVHFHVDPDEERLLMKAVERFGSQQKALVAALEALEETERLRDEIEHLRRESERQRELFAKAESLFTRG